MKDEEVKQVVRETLLSLGFDVENPKENQADQLFLRQTRQRCSRWIVLAPMTFLAAGLSGMTALGIWILSHLKWN